MTNVNFFFKKYVKCQGQKIKYLQKDLITWDIQVKYQSSCNHYSKIFSNIKVFKKKVKLSGQSHRVKTRNTMSNTH